MYAILNIDDTNLFHYYSDLISIPIFLHTKEEMIRYKSSIIDEYSHFYVDDHGNLKTDTDYKSDQHFLNFIEKKAVLYFTDRISSRKSQLINLSFSNREICSKISILSYKTIDLIRSLARDKSINEILN